MGRFRMIFVVLISALVLGCGNSYQADSAQDSDEATRTVVEREMQEIEAEKKEAKEKIQKEKEEKEKAEQEEREKVEQERAKREAKEKEEQEVREKAEQEKTEQEEREKQEQGELAETTISEQVEPSHAPKSVGNANNFDKYDISGRENTEYTYVLNTSTMKIHHPGCPSVPKIKPENFAETNKSIQELEDDGYSTCGQEEW